LAVLLLRLRRNSENGGRSGYARITGGEMDDATLGNTGIVTLLLKMCRGGPSPEYSPGEEQGGWWLGLPGAGGMDLMDLMGFGRLTRT
jgi:hypothetical protein